jgi:hypothetical protein
VEECLEKGGSGTFLFGSVLGSLGKLIEELR